MGSLAAARPRRAAIRLFLCGDVMMGRGLDQVLPHPGDPTLHESYMSSAMDYVRLAERRSGPLPKPVDCTYVWGAALDEWERRRPDLRIINLETSVTTSDDFDPKGINYRMSPGNAACLAPARPDCCVLANNHVLDWGPNGLVETLDVLKGLGLKTAGAGQTAAEAAAPAILQAPGGPRVLVVSCCTRTSGVPDIWAARPDDLGVNLIEPDVAAAERLARGLERVRRAGDIVVVSVHWGPNWGYAVPPVHRRFAHALIDLAGVALVHGHSSHHPLAMEVHNGRLILYGCGDFLNDYEGIAGHEDFRPDLALMYFPSLDRAGALTRLDIVPLQVRRFRLNRPAASDLAWIGRRLDRECRRFGGAVRQTRQGMALSWADSEGHGAEQP